MKRLTKRLLAGLLSVTLISPAFGTVLIIPMKTVNDTTYRITLKLGDNKPTEYLIDTGASFIVTSQKEINKVKGATVLRQAESVLATGKRVGYTLYNVPKINLGGCMIKDVHVAVLGGKSIRILGMQALKKVAPFQMDFDPAAELLITCK